MNFHMDAENLEDITGLDLFDGIIESDLSGQTKQEVVEWLWGKNKLDDKQYHLALARILHLETRPKD